MSGQTVAHPHSRACGIRAHDHGTACHSNCPTCHGRPWRNEAMAGPAQPVSPQVTNAMVEAARFRPCDNVRLFVRSLNLALGNERDDDLRLHVQALRNTLVAQLAASDSPQAARSGDAHE